MQLVLLVWAAALALPHGPVKELASPDGRFVLYGVPYEAGVRPGPELWILDRRTTERRKLLQLEGTARAEWSTDGAGFYVADHLASDRTESYLYDADGRNRLDVGAALLRSDPRLKPFASGHVYVETLRWIDAGRVAVRYHGHTDEAPVRCFAFRYTVDRAGKATRGSYRVTRPGRDGCPAVSESPARLR